MQTKELVILSGKGGTGKTSLTASLAILAGQSVIADCDVDASDLHLVLKPEILERHEFRSGHLAVVEGSQCAGCGACAQYCRFDAIHEDASPTGWGQVYAVDPIACEGCGVCARFCPCLAINMTERFCGDWMISRTRAGRMVHARLGIGAENSGKLVSVVRENARILADDDKTGLVIVDGPPGIGCPVISSLTGATHVLVVSEPTVSGEHDLERVMALTSHFGIPISICVNKWDINPDVTRQIEDAAGKAGASLAPGIRFDPGFTRAMIESKAVIETDCPAAGDIRSLWAWLRQRI